MGFIGVYTAIYDYVPQGDTELAIQEGDLLFILEKSDDDDWWKAKKKAAGDDDDEPVGLIPCNYIEETQAQGRAKALYDYTRQTDEELSFSEDDVLTVYDTTDPDWTLVGYEDEYGFAPANYIDTLSSPISRPPSGSTPEPHQPEPLHDEQPPEPPSARNSVQNPAAALAQVLQRQTPTAASDQSSSRSDTQQPRGKTYTPEASDDELPTPPAPSLPARPPSEQNSPRSQTEPRRGAGVVASPPYNRARHESIGDDDPAASPGGFHLYNINEMISVQGKRKKMPTTLGINRATGMIMLSPEKSRDGPQQEWTAEKLSHYSIEGKHVFLDLLRPSKSVDLHAGAKDTAEEIVSALGEIAGAVRAEGLKEVIAASSGSGKSQKRGQVLYDFMAQGDDEVTVAAGDEVIIVDDVKSDEWWMVRRLKNGQEGVVPSSYVEIIAVEAPRQASAPRSTRSTVEENRAEEKRLAKEAARSTRALDDRDSPLAEVGPGMKLPKRGSSLMVKDGGIPSSSTRGKRESSGSAKKRPDPGRIRTWTDRSASFKVEAEFIGCTDGKIHLHKVNGVKIAVPVSKMSLEDLEFVERSTGLSLDEDKPLSEIKRRSQQAGRGTKDTDSGLSLQRSAKSGAQVKGDEYDWFDFFLGCGVGPHQCERYASNFSKDSMDESVLPDITPSVLRTLGLKEGDILRVMKFLDNKYGRAADVRAKRNVSFGGAEMIDAEDGEGAAQSGSGGGLFSGPGGTLRNNTRKGRPAPAVQTNDVVDPKAFLNDDRDEPSRKANRSDSAKVPSGSAPLPVRKDTNGFDDDAWDVKPSKQTSTPPSSTSAQESSTAQAAPASGLSLSSAMRDLSLLSAPLQPVIAHSQDSQQSGAPPQSVTAGSAASQPQQPQGATASFFSQLGPPGANGQNQRAQTVSHPTAPVQQQAQQQITMPPRQRPQAPLQTTQSQSTLMPPPPPRPLSAPQNVSDQGNFGPPPLQPHLTGAPNNFGYQPQLASPGQSLNDINQMRMQQMNQSMNASQALPQQQHQPGFAPQMTGFGQIGHVLQNQPTGYGPPQVFSQSLQPSQQQYLNGQSSSIPFSNPVQSIGLQPTGIRPSYGAAPQQSMPTGSINSVLPLALQPQATGPSNINQGFGNIPPVPPLPQQHTLSPLQPQRTGPAPPVRFGVTAEPKSLAPQATGRRANLSQATPQNPFGF
ncbi:MAG: hypothetical protein M1825_002322 [Sarcosagium campestre]|nr:MAG: hypothetical protein M1825_002322 [Sarcosagium campestre]